MKKTTLYMKGTIGLFFLLTNSAFSQEVAISCEGSSDQAVLSVAKPADKYVYIACTKYGHVISPVNSWFWTKPGSFEPIFFPAQITQKNPQEVGNSVFFNSIAVSELNGQVATNKWSILDGLFDEVDGRPNRALEVLASTNLGDDYRIYIFPNKIGYSCKPICTAENLFVMISQTNDPVSW